MVSRTIIGELPFVEIPPPEADQHRSRNNDEEKFSQLGALF
jgi:hypothetical protein